MMCQGTPREANVAPSKKVVKSPVNTGDPKKGDLVYITSAGHDWMTRKQVFAGGGKVLYGRSAVVLDVYDWDSERGKEILSKREASDKWQGLESRDFKYVLLIFFPEVTVDGKQGAAFPDVLPLKHPRMDGSPLLFASYPEHLLKLTKGKL